MPHRQFVFTIPKILRRYFLRNRLLLGELVRCAWLSLKEFFASAYPELAPPPVPAAVLCLQTFGNLLSWNPHIHAIVANGCFAGETFHTIPDEVPVELPAPPQRVPREVRKSWARLIAKIYEADPMLCPHCGATMKIIKFVQKEEEIRTTLMMLGIPYNSSQPPPTDPPASDYVIVPEQDDTFAEDSDTIYLD